LLKFTDIISFYKSIDLINDDCSDLTAVAVFSIFLGQACQACI